MDAPQTYKTAGMLQLASGVWNILVSLGVIMGFIWVCIGVFWVVPLAMSVWQVMVGLKMNGGEPNPNAKTAAIVGAVAGLFSFNIISAILSGVAWMQLGNEEVAGWLEANG